MANIRKCAARFLIAAALFLGILCGVLFSGIAANAESMDKLRTDFREGSDGWEMNQLAVVSSSQGLQLLPGGRAETSDTMDGALLFIEFGSVGSGFTLELGVTDEGAAVSLAFNGDILRATGLETADGGSDAVLGSTLGAGAMLKVEMIAGYVEVSVKESDGSYDDLGSPVATFYYPEGTASREGDIAFSVAETGTTAVVRTADLYSLAGAIDIETEDAPVEEETPEETPDETGGLPWWGILLICIGGVLVLGGAAAAIVLVLKKKGGKSSPQDNAADGSSDDDNDGGEN